MIPSRSVAARGSTLIEAMISLTVLAVGMLGLVGAVTQAMASDRRARSWTLANEVAMDLVEHLERVPFNSPLLADTSIANNATPDFTQAHRGGDPNAGTDLFATAPDHNADGTDAELNAGWAGGRYPGMALVNSAAAGQPLGADDLGAYKFHRYWNVRPQSDPLNPNIIQIAVIVTYSDGSGSRRSTVAHGTAYNGAAIGAALGGAQ